MEKEKLLWELAQEKNAKAERRSKAQLDSIEENENEELFDDEKLDGKTSVFSQEEAHELEELLRSIIGNKV